MDKYLKAIQDRVCSICVDSSEKGHWTLNKEETLDELSANDLVIDRGYKGEVFEVTNLGYQIADMIEI